MSGPALPPRPRRRRRWWLALAWLGGLAAVVIALRATLLAPAPVEVVAVAAARGRVEATVTNSKAGTIEARRRAKLSPGTGGIVVERRCERGDRVAAGDVLLRLDDATPRANLELARRALDVAEATRVKACIAADRARRELERNRTLSEEELVSQDQLDALESAWRLAQADCEVAGAQAAQAQAAVDVARAELDKTVLHAPFDAIVAAVDAELGEWVTPSVPLVAAPDLIDVIDPTSLYVSAPMDEVDTASLAVDQPVRVTIDSHPGREFAGSIVRIAPFVLDVEQQNRTLEIEVELDDTALSRTLLPGTSADVEVVLEVHEDVLRVPTYALLEGEQVLVVEDGVLIERALELGLRNWEFAEVLSGLEAGERVVTSLDRPEVVAGARVTVRPGPGPSP